MHRPSREETANWITHAIGIAMSIFAAFILLPRVLADGDWTMTISCVLYLLSLLGVYICSTMSHWYSAEYQDGKPRRHFRMLDQAFIYLLIVATYTPFSAAHLHGVWWSSVLGLMWVIAITGFVSKIIFAHRVNSVAIWIYLLLGWIPALSGMPWCADMPSSAIWCIVLGGIVYTIGTVFLFNDHKRWYFHAIWHLFVIAASATHFVGILNLLAT